MPFDRVSLINLDKRRDRLGAFKAKIAHIPELRDFVRFRAVEGDRVGVPGFYSAGGGAYGCRASHTHVLELAMMDGVDSLLVLEDDVCYCPDFSDRLRDFLARVPDDWSLLMLGGQDHAPPGPTGIDGVARCANTQRTHAYAVRGLEAMRDLYRLWMRCDTHIDHHFGQFQARHPSYQPQPFLCGQDEGPSDISGRRDPVRFWSSPAAAPTARPLVLLYADRKAAERLRSLGLHYGNDRCPQTGRDKGVIGIEGAGWPADRLAKWADLIAAEAADRGDVPCLWHEPMPVAGFLTSLLGRPTVEVRAPTVEAGVAALPDLAPAFRAARVVWCWRGRDRELLEGLAYHGFHRGHYRDDITGLDQGVRRVVETGEYGSLRQLVAQLRREADQTRRGKVLLAHPELDIGRVRATLPAEEVVVLEGADLGGLLAQAEAVARGGGA